MERIGFADEVIELISIQGWKQSLELAIEVMSLFELDRMIISLSHHETVIFEMFGDEYQMSYKEFSLAMGLVNVEYAHIEL